MESNRAVALIVGFSEYQNWLFRLALMENGYDAFEATDAFEAIGALQDYEPEAVLINARVPGLTPWELIAILQKYRPANRYVVIGGPDGFSDFADDGSRQGDYQLLSNDNLYYIPATSGLPS